MTVLSPPLVVTENTPQYGGIIVDDSQIYQRAPFNGTYRTLPGKSGVHVSAKGIVNGLSSIENDGADFGPDTTLGATSTGQWGAPYTETYGWQETFNSLNGITVGSYTVADKKVVATAGIYAISTQINVPDMALYIDGTYNGTVLQAQTSGMTIMKLVTGSSDNVHYNYFHGLTFDPNGLASTGLDMTQTSTSNGNDSWFDSLVFLDGFSSTMFVMDGQSGTTLNNIQCGQTLPQTAVGLHWLTASASGCRIQNSTFYATMYLGMAIISITDETVISSIYLINNMSSLTLQSVYFLGDYLVADINVPSHKYIGQIIMIGCEVNINLDRPFLTFASSTTIDGITMKGCHISMQNTSTTSTAYWIQNMSTLNLRHTEWDGSVGSLGGLFSAPFGLIASASANQYEVGAYGFAYSTPSLPSATGSANSVTNSEGRPMRIYQTGMSGTHIIDASGNDESVPDSGEITLDPQCQIYYATTVATSWTWYES